MKSGSIRQLAGLAGGLVLAGFLALPAQAQTQEETRPILQSNRIQDLQQVQEIDPRVLEMARQNQTLIQTIDTRLDPNAATDSTAQEVDRFGRPLAPINWGDVRERLAQQESYAGEVNLTAATAYQPPPVPRNIETTELMRPRLPVLMPNISGVRTRSARESGVEDGMLVFPREHFYSSTMHINGLMIEVSGTRIQAAEMRDPAYIRRMRTMRDSNGAIITQTRSGLEVSFTRFGAAYNILIICENPEEMTECHDPETARAVFDRLTIMGGSPDGMDGEE